MDVKRVLGESVETLHVTREGSALHTVVPFEEGTTESSPTIQDPLSSVWLRLCMRPIKVDQGLGSLVPGM